jgi:alpha-ketoglutarate-dependent taurine dioxygenase
MTEIQAEALDMVHLTAEKHAFELHLQLGDIETVNNFAMFHARRGFVDEPAANRHLIRLWL